MSRNNRLPDPVSPEKEILCLIPLWDMINHRTGKATTDVNVETKTIEFYAMEDCLPSSEVIFITGDIQTDSFSLFCGCDANKVYELLTLVPKLTIDEDIIVFRS
ncbi:unnamed protein product [Dibothriocephalus latus]|uniref:SET domain-containing protein n=1 Tax=Dibothriocephalus latus TaxID=60516 RepID=A0A3P7N2Q4_DIBLA|nr:unnamed protein product [Dibothriocephalus latus]